MTTAVTRPRTVTARITTPDSATLPVSRPVTCRNPYCGGCLTPTCEDTPATYCVACADLADDHDQGEHDHDSHEHCPACQPRPSR